MIINKIVVVGIPWACLWCDFCVATTDADKEIGSSDWVCVAGLKGRDGKEELGGIDVIKERPDWCMLESN